MNSKQLQQFVVNVITKTENPERVKIGLYDDLDFLGIFSNNGTNDTCDWYEANSPLMEAEIKKAGLAWAYLFDVVKNDYTCVSMFIGKDINAQKIRDFAMEKLGNIPETSHFNDGAYVDVCDKYREISALEEEVTRMANTVLRVFHP